MARRKSTTTAASAPEAVAAAPAERDADNADQVTLVGRLCADPVLRHTKSGIAVSTIRIAVNEPDAEATFHSVVVWKRTAEVVCQYLRKGRLVEVTGRPQTRSWVDGDGNEREAVEVSAYRVQFLSRQVASATSHKEVA